MWSERLKIEYLITYNMLVKKLANTNRKKKLLCNNIECCVSSFHNLTGIENDSHENEHETGKLNVH